jgi:peptide/nickel transport system substrate-binding protein
MKLTLSEAEQDQIQMSEIIQSQMKKIGVNVTIDIMENASFLNLIVDGGFDAFLLNSVGNSADPGEAMKSFIATRPTWSNTTRYKNEELTSLIEKGQQTIDETQKLEIFQKVQKIVNEECPWVFIVHNRIAFATRTNIQGLVAYPSTVHFYKEAHK